MNPDVVPGSSSISGGNQNDALDFSKANGPQGISSKESSHDNPVGEISGDLPSSELVVQAGRMNRNPIDITPDLEAHVKKLYGTETDLPYHGWHHIEETRREAAVLVERCKKAGIDVDVVALDHAIICHDLLYSIDPTMFRFKSREELAAHYAYNLLRFYGADEVHARKVERIVLATNFLVEPTGVEEMIMRAADLKNLGGSYSDFRGNTVKLWEEAKRLSREEVSFEDHVKRTLRFLPLYVWRFLRLTDDALNERGASIWHEKTLKNLITLFSEINGGRDKIRVVAQVSLNASDPVIFSKHFPSNTFFIAVDSDNSALQSGLREARVKHLPKGEEGGSSFVPAEIPAYFVPGKTEALPIEDETCDEVYVPCTVPLNVEEYSRIVREGGELIVDTALRDVGPKFKAELAKLKHLGFSTLGIEGTLYRFSRKV